MRTYIGVDYHRKCSYMTVMDEKGKILAQGQVANQPEAVREFLNRAGANGASTVMLEATRNWTVMHDWLEELVDEVHLAHPLKVKAIAEAKIKTDKIDAKVLAHLLRCEERGSCPISPDPVQPLDRLRTPCYNHAASASERPHP